MIRKISLKGHFEWHKRSQAQRQIGLRPLSAIETQEQAKGVAMLRLAARGPLVYPCAPASALP
ncbi:MAG: hypothetical protein ABW184_10705 [Sphingobium sp.]